MKRKQEIVRRTSGQVHHFSRAVPERHQVLITHDVDLRAEKPPAAAGGQLTVQFLRTMTLIPKRLLNHRPSLPDVVLDTAFRLNGQAQWEDVRQHARYPSETARWPPRHGHSHHDVPLASASSMKRRTGRYQYHCPRQSQFRSEPSEPVHVQVGQLGAGTEDRAAQYLASRGTEGQRTRFRPADKLPVPVSPLPDALLRHQIGRFFLHQQVERREGSARQRPLLGQGTVDGA